MLPAARRGLPRQTPAIEDELRWGAGPAETAAASLAVDLAAYGAGTYGLSRASLFRQTVPVVDQGAGDE